MFKTATALFQYIYQDLLPATEDHEAKSLAYLLCDKIFHLDKVSIIGKKELQVPPVQMARLEQILSRLKNHEPVQYILGEAEFYGRQYSVNPHVLIPRPETEELVHRIIQEIQSFAPPGFSLLDIGTGSGCIPVTVKKVFPLARVIALDVDENALAVAEGNARKHRAAVQFLQADILKTVPQLAPMDVIVSNPPYVRETERAFMAANVVNFEPGVALFVPNENPLLFYERITCLATAGLLKDTGRVYFEINEAYGPQVASLMREQGFKAVTVFQDMQGKDRIVRGNF